MIPTGRRTHFELRAGLRLARIRDWQTARRVLDHEMGEEVFNEIVSGWEPPRRYWWTILHLMANRSAYELMSKGPCRFRIIEKDLFCDRHKDYPALLKRWHPDTAPKNRGDTSVELDIVNTLRRSKVG
jgi:hypothetical protein